MRQVVSFYPLAVSAMLLAACGSSNHENQSAAAGDDAKSSQQSQGKAEPVFENLPAKASSPFRVDYEIIGTPVVGSPVTVELRVDSAMGARPMHLDYRITDASSMSFHESQPKSILASPAARETFVTERVTLIPQREGRLYFNVSASVETEHGTTSSVIAIPIHVGEVSTAPVEHGEIENDENDEPVRVLTPD